MSDDWPPVAFVLLGKAIPYRGSKQRVIPGKGINPKTGKPKFFVQHYTPKHVEVHQDTLRLAASEAMTGRDMCLDAVEMIIKVFLPIPQSKSQKWKAAALAGAIRPTPRPDLDRYVNAIKDACNMVVFKDDAQVVGELNGKWYSDKPRTEVTIRKANGT